MLVGEVYLLRTGFVTDSPLLSAGRPVRSSVMATRLRQVSRAHRPARARSPGLGTHPPFSSWAGAGVPPYADDPAAPATASAPLEASKVRRLMKAVI